MRTGCLWWASGKGPSKAKVLSGNGIHKSLFRDSMQGHSGGVADLAGRQEGYQSETFFRTQVIPELSPQNFRGYVPTSLNDNLP